MPHSLKLPPGLQLYNIKLIGKNTVAPAAVVVAITRLLRALHVGPELPFSVVAVLAAVSVPVAYAFGVKYAEWSVRRRARLAGAVIPRRWEGKRIGNMDILEHGMERFQNGYIGEGFWDKNAEYGHVQEMYIMWDSIYLTTDPGITKAILATSFDDFYKGPEFRDTMHSVLGTGVFNADGELWKFHRTMTRPYFSRDRISHFELFNRHADLAIKKMKDRFASGRCLDFQDLVARFTLDSATEFLFGTCVNSLHSDLPYAHNDPEARFFSREASEVEAFATAFLGAQDIISVRTRIGWMWRLKEMFHDASAQHMRVVDAFIQPILEAALAKNKQAGKEGKESKDDDNETLLDHLVKFTDDPVVLHDETLNILIAGRDTTATTLSFAVYLLCLNPAVLRRLREEVLDHIGPTAMPTFEDIKGMRYLRAVINETLRLFPAVPFNVRVASRDTTIPNPDPSKPPIFVAKNTSVAYSVFLMHRRKDLWGPDALDFDPDRFLDDRLNKYFTNNPFIFLPFNAGPRICLGQQFAYNEMSFFLIRLLQSFSHMEMDLAAQPPDARAPAEWAGVEGQQGREKIIAKSHLTMYIHGGLWVRMTQAERDG